MNKPVYNSVFKKEFQDLVELKRALGFIYKAEAYAFGRIDAFFNDNQLSEKCITKQLCSIWCSKRSHESIVNQAHRISTMRIFSSYLNELGYLAYIPPKGITRKRPRYNAHIYTDDELRLARISDFILNEGYITVHEAKNHKDRLVPIHPQLIDKCLELKKKIHSSSPDDEYFFMIRPGQPMPLVNVYKNFRRYLEKAGIPHTGRGPRVHDFRHTYCVNLLRKWTDLLAYLPYMKTMLGHEGFEETAYYLKLTTERFPYIKERLKSAFPDLIKEAAVDEHEFY